MMKIYNTILAVFQLANEMSAKAAHKFMANLDYMFYVCVLRSTKQSNETERLTDLVKLNFPMVVRF